MSLAIFAQLLTLLILQYTPEFTNGQNDLELTITPNLVYTYERVTIECTFDPRFSLLWGEFTVFQGKTRIGYLLYNCTGELSPISTGNGVFSGLNAAGCGVLKSTSLSGFFHISLFQEINTRCSATVMNTANLETVALSSLISSFVVLSLPGSPQFSPSTLIFNDGLNVTVSCGSNGGIPAASLLLEIRTSQTNELLNTASGISVTSSSWTMSKRYHNAIASCRITNHIRITSPTTAYIWQSGVTELTFSNPVYEYDYMSLSCFFSKDCSILPNRCIIKIRAFNGTEPKGSLTSEYSSSLSNATGVLTYSSHYYDWSLNKVTVRMTAFRSMELDYDCASYNYYAVNEVLSMTSATHLTVFVAPSWPTITPGDLIFIDGNRVNISCRTYSTGKPEALLQLLVNSTQAVQAQTFTGTGFASIRLTVSSAWHGANVSCRVLNHVRYIMNSGGVIRVIHLAANGTPDKVYTYSNDSILDCSSYIVGFPEPTFQWSVPLQLNLSYVDALKTRYLLVGKRQSGIFNCTATSLVTGKNVTVTFTVLDAPPNVNTLSEGEIVGAVIGSLAALATIVFMTVIIKRRRHSKFISRLLTSCLDPKKSEPPANPSNVYVQATGSGLATVTGDAVEYSQSLQPVYSVLGENRGEAGDVYSSLDKTYQNSAFSD